MRANSRLFSVVLLLPALAACRTGASPPPTPPPASASEPIPAAVIPAPMAPACTRTSPGQGPLPVGAEASGGTIALARAGDHLIAYVADEDERALRTIDVDARSELSRAPLEGRPSSLLLAPDGRIVVALRDQAALVVFEPAGDLHAAPVRRCRVDTPVEPVGLAATPDGTTLLVASRWGHALSVFAMDSLDRRRTIDLPRDPQAVTASADGKKAVISHVAGARLSVVDLEGEGAEPRSVSTRVTEHVGSRVHFMPTSSNGKHDNSRVVVRRHERFGSQGFALVRLASGRILLPEVMVETGPSSGVSSGYGDSSSFPTVMGDVSVIDAAKEAISFAPLRQGFGASDCLLPRAAAVDETGGEVLIACLGIKLHRCLWGQCQAPSRRPAPELSGRRRPDGPRGRRGVSASGGLLPIRQRAPRPFAGDAAREGWTAAGREQTLDGDSDSADRPNAAAPATLAEGPAAFPRRGRPASISSDRPAPARAAPRRPSDEPWHLGHPHGPRRLPCSSPPAPEARPPAGTAMARTCPAPFSRTVSRLGGDGPPGSLGPRRPLPAYIQSLEAPTQAPAPIEDPRLGRGAALFHAEAVGCARLPPVVARPTGSSTRDRARRRVDRDPRLRHSPRAPRLAARSLSHDGRSPTCWAC